MHEDRSNQQGRRFPLSSFEMLTSTRRCRVWGLLVACTQRTHSHRAIGVMSCHTSRISAGCRRQGGDEVAGHVRLRPRRRYLESQFGGVTRTDSGDPLEGHVDADPVATAAVRLYDGHEVVPSDRRAHGYLPTA